MSKGIDECDVERQRERNKERERERERSVATLLAQQLVLWESCDLCRTVVPGLDFCGSHRIRDACSELELRTREGARKSAQE